MSTGETITITHNAARNRFEASIDGALARLEYRVDDGVMNIHHTEVPAQFAGRGVAGQLMQAAIDHARANSLRVLATCSYAQAWMQRHPQALEVRVPGASTD
ncbi:MAG: GNAT family N-acetyltransferase [Casimicrobiaceae bacterium]